MKTIQFFLLLAVVAVTVSSCDKVSYRKTKSGMAYKLFRGSGKDSLIKMGDVAKYEVTYKLNDSVLYSSYGKMPGYAKLMLERNPSYSITEVLPMMRKGDSAVIIQIADSLIKQGMQLAPNVKKGDRIITQFRVVEVFTNDSIAMANFKADQERDRPRQMKEQAEQEEKYNKERIAARDKQDIEFEKSGEIAKEMKEMEAYLAAKKINAQRTGKGTYVRIDEKGNGPAAALGKFIRVKYTGKVMATDSTFESNIYAYKLGEFDIIRGWNEGLLMFNEGGKGTIYIPGFLAYANSPSSAFKPFEALKFDVEVMNVSDTALNNAPVAK